jgi:hypothetical protein
VENISVFQGHRFHDQHNSPLFMSDPQVLKLVWGLS